MAKENTKVAKKKETDLAAFDYGEDNAGGMDNVDREEMRIPFVRILQSGSPQVDPTKGGNIVEGAKAGMIILMSTEEVWESNGSVKFIPCYRTKDYIEWTPVDAGGGFVGRFDWNDPKIADLRSKQGRFGKLDTNDGTEISQTFYLYGLMIPPDGAPRRVVLGFSSTQIKKYQSVIDRVSSVKFIKDGRSIQPPLYAWRFNITSSPEKNKKGSWYGIRLNADGNTNIASLLPKNDPIFSAAKEFHELVKSGEVSADMAQMSNDGNGGSTENEPLPADDVPDGDPLDA